MKTSWNSNKLSILNVSIPNLIHIVASAKNKFRGNFYLLFDYMAYDLTGIVDKKVKFNLSQIKYIMRSLLRGLDYLHNE